MDIFLNKLKARLQGEGLTGYEVKVTDLRKDQNKTVNIAEVKYGPLYARIVPVTDDHRLLNAEVYTHKMTRAKLTHVSQDMLSDALVAYARESAQGNVVDHLHAKSKEPYTRIAAEVEEVNDEEIDAMIEQLRDELSDKNVRGQMPESDSDEMEEWDAKTEYKHIVKGTFPKDEPKVETEKRPVKTNVEAQSPADGVVKWHGDGLEAAESAEDFRDALIEAKRQQLSECRITKDPNAIKDVLPAGMKLNLDKDGNVCITPKSVATRKVVRHPYGFSRPQ